MPTVQMGKLSYNTINIVVCLWNNKKLKEVKLTLTQCQKNFQSSEFDDKNTFRKKENFFSDFSCTHEGICVYGHYAPGQARKPSKKRRYM